MKLSIQKQPFHVLKPCLFLLILSVPPSLKHCHSRLTAPTPLNCTEMSRVCTSFLAFKRSQNETLNVIMSMFDVSQEHLTVDNNNNNNYNNYIYVRKNCSCMHGSTISNYLTNTTYTVKKNDDESTYDHTLMNAYGGLAYLATVAAADFKRPSVHVGDVLKLRMFCGCSDGLWNYLLSYVMKENDSVEMLASRFGVSMDSIEEVNEISNSDNVTVGAVYYIPLNSVPGEPYPVEIVNPPAPAPAPAPPLVANVVVNQNNHMARLPYRWIVGSLGAGLALIITALCCFVYLRSSASYDDKQGSREKEPKGGKVSHKFRILGTIGFCYGSRFDVWKKNIGESSERHVNIPKVIVNDVFEVEKPVVFLYEEIFSATDGFSESNLLGHGTYSAVYYGLLRDREVAIKRMTETKTKEFIAEMKVLCRVHHSNLVELIGYAASDDKLFLIYEYAHKGSLKSHLHDPHTKGNPTLSWITRVHIALDAARGLEYIHEHTKPHYVHRDVKTSNILLDGSFKAKISDFGLAKLVGRSNDDEASATRVVGTYGYLAPEYLRDGLATAKSDVYAFGIILFEIISGKDVIIQTESGLTKNSERRSLASVMLATLKNAPDSISTSSLKDHIDPSLMDLFPHDCVFKMAILAKQCVDDDPILRPDMKQVVISLSNILLSSVEWEATLAGNSQVFSGLVQGR